MLKISRCLSTGSAKRVGEDRKAADEVSWKKEEKSFAEEKVLRKKEKSLAARQGRENKKLDKLEQMERRKQSLEERLDRIRRVNRGELPAQDGDRELPAEPFTFESKSEVLTVAVKGEAGLCTVGSLKYVW